MCVAKWERQGTSNIYVCTRCKYRVKTKLKPNAFKLENRFCRRCGAKIDES